MVKIEYFDEDNSAMEDRFDTTEEIKEIEAARTQPIVFDEDCPETTPEKFCSDIAKINWKSATVTTLVGKIKGTVIEKLLRDHDVLRDGML